MPTTVIVHIANEEPIVGEVEELPVPSDSLLVLHNPRQRTGKDLHFLAAHVTVVIWPWLRINFVEIMPSATEEEIIGFVRE